MSLFKTFLPSTRHGVLPCISIRLNSSSSKRYIQRQKNDHYAREARLGDMKSRAGFKLMQIDDKFRLIKPGQNIVDLGFAPGAWSQVAVDRLNGDGIVLGIDILMVPPPKGVSVMQGNILSATTHNNIRTFFNEQITLKEREERIKEKLQVHEKVIAKTTEQKNDAQWDFANIYDSDTSSPEQPSYYDIESRVSSIEGKVDELSDQLSNLGKAPIDQSGMSISKYPVDLIISDMCAPYLQESGFWNHTTNRPYARMSNTTGLKFKDHLNSMDLCDAALILACDLLKKDGCFVCKYFSGKEDKLLEDRLKRVFHSVKRFKPEASRSESQELYFVCQRKRTEEVDKLSVFKGSEH